MIHPVVRARLERFLADHGEDDSCEDQVCIVDLAQEWVTQMRARGYPEHELLLLGVAYQAYIASKRAADRQVAAYQAAIASFVAKNGGVLKIDLDDVDVLKDGTTMAAFPDPDGRAITYRLIEPGSRS
jgi:hypothetical protein